MGYKRIKSEISHDSIVQLIRHGLGNSAQVIASIPLRGGLFNTSYRIELAGAYPVVLRIAPPPEKELLWLEKDLLQRGVWIYKKMRGLTVPVPEVLYHDFSQRIIDRCWAIFEFKTGKNLFYHQKYLMSKEIDELYSELGEYAKFIHSLENAEGWFGYPPPFAPQKSWCAFIKRYISSLSEDMEKNAYIILPEEYSLATIADKMTPLLNEVKVPKLIHGDLWFRNILVAKQPYGYRISAILDWDRNVWGDPCFEWILYGLELPDSFWKAYGKDKLVKESPDYLRMLLYRSCGGLQAALEESLHFGHKQQALLMLGYAIRDLQELQERI